ncbi:hypothetical protein AB0K25_00570 [Micromonospora sp. NPDC049257]|uniref:hypothetical protein n=1 Tax=Micromonospora sp. NPDC049257 TaxID=3155771 RepID=UPI003436595A
MAGTLDATELDRVAVLANLDDGDRVAYTARNATGSGDLDGAVTLRRSAWSPAAGSC